MPRVDYLRPDSANMRMKGYSSHEITRGGPSAFVQWYMAEMVSAAD
jgi:hypothetical protein